MAHIKTYLGNTVIGVHQIDPVGEYVPNFNGKELQRLIVDQDEKFGKDNWTSFEYVKEDAK